MKENKEGDAEMQESNGEENVDVDVLKTQISQIKKELMTTKARVCKTQEFEKDNDRNFHVDFIYACANIRAANYNLTEMDWITTKIKAGNIVPALSTTTSVIAALQTIELLKIIKGLKPTQQANSFLNLAIPMLTQSEPQPALKHNLCQGFEVSVWTKWQLSGLTPNDTLKTILVQLDTEILQSRIQAQDIVYGSNPLFLKSMAQM